MALKAKSTVSNPLAVLSFFVPLLIIYGFNFVLSTLIGKTLFNQGDRNLTTVRQFLVSIPRDYYTVKQINKVKALGKEHQALLVDVREPKEYAHGHIKGAINLPLRSLTDNLDQISKTRSVILYCSTGYRTAMRVMALQMLGYNNFRGFPPSIEGWKAAGEALY